MFALVYFSVPLYKIFCDLTGFQGFNKQNDLIVTDDEKIDSSELELNFVFASQVADGLDWSFYAPDKMVVNEGFKYDVVFKAKNNNDFETTGTSTFNILPPKIGPYLYKVQCFCFLDQTIKPNETVEFPVTFYVDPLILDDPEARRTKNVTLSYTFFEKKG